MTESSELACPRCASAMVRRRRRSDGAEFWGCPRYPECWGTRKLDEIQAVRPDAGDSAPPVGTPWTDQSWSRGTPGGSAQATFERRRARHKEHTRERLPQILMSAGALAALGIGVMQVSPQWQLAGWLILLAGGLKAATLLVEIPQHVRSYETGADGEVRTAELLAPLEDEGFVVLHDRRIPRARENIDQIVVGPPGVFVIETKSYAGRLRVRDGELVVAGRRRVGVADQVARQAAAVAAIVGEVAVERVICVHRADMPFFGRPRVEGVPILTGRELVRYLRGGPPVLEPDEVDRLAAVIARALPPAS